MNYSEILKKLKSLRNEKNIEGMARFGIKGNVLGISIKDLREIKKGINKNHELAMKLFNTNIREAKILASFVDEPSKVTEKQMNEWVIKLDSWDEVDQVATLFEQTPFVVKKVKEWSNRKEEFVKRMSYSIIAWQAIHNKKASNEYFTQFFPIIIKASNDERNYIKKAVSWALRNIGKKNKELNNEAIKTAKQIKKIKTKSADWVSNDVLKELTCEKIQKRFK